MYFQKGDVALGNQELSHRCPIAKWIVLRLTLTMLR